MFASASFAYRPVRIPALSASTGRARRPSATRRARTERVRVGGLDDARRRALADEMFSLFVETCTGFTRGEFERLFLRDPETELELTFGASGALRGFSIVRDRG